MFIVMKRFLKLILPFFVILSLASCSKESDTNPGQQSSDTYTTVSFNLFGQELSTSESPLTLTKGTDPKDWYAFQVYSKKAGSDEGYGYYAYGFFDNKEDMIINLKDGYEYKFDVCMFPEGSTKIYNFCLVNSGWAPVDNKFMISSSETVRYMYKGYLYMKYPTWDTYDRPMVDRFMGKKEGYTPQKDGVVNIDMKRVAFAAKFVPSNFTSGKLEISVEGSGIISMAAGVDTEWQEMISFNWPGNAYDSMIAGQEYSESIPVNIVWIKDDGVRTPIANQNVSFKRNVLTTINFEVKESASSSSFSFTANEKLETGSTVTIGGDGTNTGVDPN